MKAYLVDVSAKAIIEVDLPHGSYTEISSAIGCRWIAPAYVEDDVIYHNFNAKPAGAAAFVLQLQGMAPRTIYGNALLTGDDGSNPRTTLDAFRDMVSFD